MACFYIQNLRGNGGNSPFPWKLFLDEFNRADTRENQEKVLKKYNILITGNNFEEVKQKILNTLQDWNSLNFYSTSYSTKVDEAFNAMALLYADCEKSSLKVGVKAAIHEFNGNNGFYKVKLRSEVLEFAALFLFNPNVNLKGFGDYMHEYMAILDPNSTAAEDVITEMMNFLQQKSSEIKPNWFTEYPMYGDFLRFIQNAAKNRTGVVTSLHEIREKLAKRYKNKKVKSEQLIAIKTSGFHKYLRGQIDAFYYDDDGNSEIVDFKTSVRLGDVHSLSEFEHYLLLCVYRLALIQQKLGTENSIKITNIIFNYNPDGSIGFDENTGYLNMDDQFVGIENLRKARLFLKNYIPETNTFTSNADNAKLAIEVNRKLDILFDLKGIGLKFTEEYIQELLDERLRKGMHFYCYATKTATGKNCQIVKEQNPNKPGEFVYTLTYLDSKGKHTVYKLKTAKEIADSEYKSSLLLLLSDTNIIISWIQNKNIVKAQSLKSRDKAVSETFYANILKYMNQNWTVYSCPALEACGIILLKHTNGTIDILSLTEMYDELQRELDDSGNLIEAIVPKKHNGIPTKSIGNMLHLKTVIALSEWLKTVTLNEKLTIGDIKVLSLKDGSTTRNTNSEFVDCIRLLQLNSEDFKGSYDIISKNIKFASTIQQLLTELQDGLATKASILFNSLDDNFDHLSIFLKKLKLRVLLNKMLLKYGREIFINYKATDVANFDPQNINLESDYGKLFATISAAILQLDGFLSGNPTMVTKHGLTTQDTVSALLLLFVKGEINDTTDKGRKVTGIFGGIDMANTYNNPSEYIDYANKRITGAHNTIKSEFIRTIDDTNEESIRFIRYEIEIAGVIPGGVVTDVIAGRHDLAYKRLLEVNDKNEPTPRLRNPYTDNTLNEAEKRYAMFCLWKWNKLKQPDSIFPAKYKKMSFEDMLKDEEAEAFFKELLSLRLDSRNMPLKPSSRVRNKAALVADYIKGNKTGKDVWESMKKGLTALENPNDLAIDQLDRLADAMKRLEVFNLYRDLEESRESMLKSRTLDDFEMDFNYLTNDMELAFIKERHEKLLIPFIKDIIIQMQIVEKTTGVNMQELIDGILDRTKIMLYGDNLIPTEDKAAMGAVGVVKQALSTVKLGLRPALAVKELTVGRIKNFETVAAGILKSPSGNRVELKNLISAGMEVIPEGLISGSIGAFVGHHELGLFTKIEKLSFEYSITDADMNSISDSATATNYGISNVGKRALYYFSVRPDWYNRNILFVACMMLDGCWEAHTFNETTHQVEYDMRKDERFSDWWAHKDNAVLTENLLKLKALYIAMMQEFLKDNPDSNLHYGEITGENGKPVYSLLPKAYTTLLTMAIKELIGMLYGMYDHEEKSNFENLTMWNMLTSMLTYLPGDIHRYFMKKGLNSIGSYLLNTNANDEKLYIDENGNETTDPKNADGSQRLPSMIFKGDQTEGLFISMLSVLGKIGRGSWEFVTSGKTDTFKTITDYQLRNSLVCLFNMLFKILLASILINVIRGDRSDSELDRMSALSIDTLTRASNDLDFYNSVIKPIDEFGIAGVSFLQDMSGDIINVLGAGSPDNIARLYENISTIKDLHLDL